MPSGRDSPAREEVMEILILIFKLTVRLTLSGGGAGSHTTEDNDDCARGQIVPC
jgi:hypothetical protein